MVEEAKQAAHHEKLPDLDPESAMRGTWDQLLDELREKKEKFLLGGGPDKIADQHSRGKLFVRERLDLLFDPGTFVEYGLLGDHNPLIPTMQGKWTPGDGVVRGTGSARRSGCRGWSRSWGPCGVRALPAPPTSPGWPTSSPW